jgi:redox-sensing transcriptional repressor
MLNNDKKISEAVIKRLPRYLRIFKELSQSKLEGISSGKIASLMGVTASQVRQDFCCFGGFGQQGYGYDTVRMVEELSNILGLNREYKTIIVGAGNIGRALVNYKGFKDDGFFVSAMFDIAPPHCGASKAAGIIPQRGANESSRIESDASKADGESFARSENIPVYGMEKLENYIAENSVDIAVVAVPKDEAEDVLVRLVKAGIKNFWNFAPVELHGGEGIIIENISMSDSLFVLSYMLNRRARAES